MTKLEFYIIYVLVIISTTLCFNNNIRNNIDNVLSSILVNDKIMNSNQNKQNISPFNNLLNELKDQSILRLWATSNIEPYKVSKSDLQLITRTSFATNDYYNDIITSINERNSISFKSSYLIISIISILTSSIVIPQLPLISSLKNVLGLSLLSLPFLLIIIIFLFPNITNNILQINNNKYNNERILYHEAGHFLIGYICGIPIIEYDLNGDRDSGINIIASIPTIQEITNAKNSINVNTNSNNKQLTSSELFYASKTGNLLITAMAGIVSETLYFGNSKGGIEDITIAISILNNYNSNNNNKGIDKNDIDSYLRWAILKSLVLLRLYRDLLDDLIIVMKDNKPISDCIICIEESYQKHYSSIK